MPSQSSRYLYVGRGLDMIAVFAADALADTTERHRVVLDVGALVATSDVLRAVEEQPDIAGAVVAAASGIVDKARLRILSRALGRGLRAWLHWPVEEAVECIDAERLQSLERHRRAAIAIERIGRPAHRLKEAAKRFKP